jgi:antitoxin MazE
MEIQIIKIGNSKGIILSKAMIEKYGFSDKIEITMKRDHIELKPVIQPRQGWDEEFKKLHDSGDDKLLLDDVLDDDLLEEWK